jgi:hypothetical protein
MKKASNTTSDGYMFRPYLSTEEAFLALMTDFRAFLAKFPNEASNRTFMHNGPNDPDSGLLPRELLGLVILANVAMFESGDIWVPGYMLTTKGNPLPQRKAHDGAIRCVSGPESGKYMRFEQTMATKRAGDATPEDIEGAILRAANRKSENGEDYVGETALIVLSDYIGELRDLRQLAIDAAQNSYKAIYLIAPMSEKFKDFVCVVLKNPADPLKPISVKFDRRDGVADVAMMR